MGKLRRAIWKIYDASRNSWGGRGLFLWHVLFTIIVLRHYGIDSFALPVMGFIVVNVPQIIILSFIGVSLTSKTGIVVLASLVISIPWWAYGVAAEFAVRRYLQQK